MRRLALVAILAALVAAPAATATMQHTAGTSVTFARTISGKGNLDGRWTMKLTVDNTRYRIARNGAFVARGKIRAGSGNRLAFTDTGGPGACAATGQYTYRESSDETTLSFKAVSDVCTNRRIILTGAWKLAAST